MSQSATGERDAPTRRIEYGLRAAETVKGGIGCSFSESDSFVLGVVMSVVQRVRSGQRLSRQVEHHRRSPERRRTSTGSRSRTRADALSAMFLNRGGSPVPGNGREDRQRRTVVHAAGSGGQADVVVLRAAGGKLTGTVGTAANSVKVTGVRPPQWAACDANASHTFGKPVALFDGTSMTPWGVQFKDKPLELGD